MKRLKRVAVVLCALGGMADVRGQHPEGLEAALDRIQELSRGRDRMTAKGQADPDAGDISRCLMVLAAGDDEARKTACLAVNGLVGQPFFADLPAQLRSDLVQSLTRHLDSERADLAEFAMRALRTMLEHPGLVDERSRRVVTARVLGQVLQLDAEDRRRAALLLASIGKVAGPSMQKQIGRTLLLALARYPVIAASSDRDHVAAEVCTFSLARLWIEDRKLADDLADRFLDDLGRKTAFGSNYERGHALFGLARTFAVLEGERRTTALAALRAAVDDSSLLYQITSGERSPSRHAGHEALAVAVPAMTRGELDPLVDEVVAARRRHHNAGTDKVDERSIFESLEQAIALRSSELRK